MDLLLSMRGSKKTSEAGVWVADDEVKVCMCCKASFGLFIRKHHCRQCGSVVCGDCSSNRKFLESSRTGAPKRICDACHDIFSTCRGRKHPRSPSSGEREIGRAHV
jgi:hypothetical protein